MKKLFSSILVTATVLLATMFSPSKARAQPYAEYSVINPLIVTSGSFTQPPAYTPVSAGGTTQIFPWYTKLDTVTNTGLDTFRQKIASKLTNVYTWAHVTGISGTNTSCVVKLWTSADSGTGADFIQVDSGIVSAINPVAYLVVPNGWPYRNLMWTFKGVGTHSSSWFAGLELRYMDDAEDQELYDNRRRRPDITPNP